MAELAGNSKLTIVDLMKLEAYIDLYKYNFVYTCNVHVPFPFEANKRKLLGQMKLLVSVWKKVLVIFVCDAVLDSVQLYYRVMGVRVRVGTGDWGVPWLYVDLV